MQTYDRDSKVETPAEKLRVCLWLIGKFENADEVLPAVETALKSLKSPKLYTKKPRSKKPRSRVPSPSEVLNRHPEDNPF
jgi:hypothetical protein